MLHCLEHLAYDLGFHFGGVFPECVARVPVSLWGLGVEGVCSTLPNRSQPSATVRNRSQPFATVRNRPCGGRMAVPMVSSAKGVIFVFVSCEVSVTFQHISQNTMPATEFAPCRHLTLP